MCIRDSLGEIILRPAVKLQFTYLDERIFFVPPDLRDIKGIFIMFFCLFFGHYLNVHGPFREITAFNGLQEVAAEMCIRDSSIAP